MSETKQTEATAQGPESGELHILQWQFQLTWQLASQYHLPALTDEACLWEPTGNSWTVRADADGIWHADFVIPEPEPAPTVSIGWVTWHLIWWWSGLQAKLDGQTPPGHEETTWPGSAEATVARLEELAQAWQTLLAGLSVAELDKPLAYPWPEPRPLRDALAWANVELMKNVAEIGYVRLLYEATHANHQGTSRQDQAT